MEQNYLGYSYAPIYHQLQAQSHQNDQNSFSHVQSEASSEMSHGEHKRETENDPQVMNQFLPSIFNHHPYRQPIPHMPWENNFNYQYQPYGAMNYCQPPPFDARFMPQTSAQYPMHGFSTTAGYQQAPSFVRQNYENVEGPNTTEHVSNLSYYSPPTPSPSLQPQPSKPQQVFNCSTCDKSFTTSTHYKRHLSTKSHVNRSSVSTINLSDLSKGSGGDPVIIKTGDREIQITFSQQNNPITDLSEAEVVLIDKIEKELSGIEPSMMRIKEEQQFECFQSSSPVGAVSSSSASEFGEFCCLVCNKNFAKKCYLTQHNKTMHEGLKPFKCVKCGKKYSTNDDLNKHLTKHTAVKAFKCLKCPKAFVHKTDLKRHEILHQGVKPHVCETCRKGFIRHDHLVKHIESHKKKMERMQKILTAAMQ